ncbi:putative quinol monooxygenase [Paraburkholderia sp. DHOC27]|uniref:putative quinol monooxygenase n=1 Tax=Paraburkholderia sp. DHOC27 TaxID=2303330 RepID=UPI000E3D8A57|nr:putative quinol monooxygenase [Paraburkholderia sp. DHOC27]RFU49676.1 antibiotic biosynthesis monooxygenase [Paraburkholderia sp. DHOC27]
MTSPVKTVAVFEAKEGLQGELEKLLRSMIAPSRAEPGNLRYDLWQDIDIPRRFVLDELYQNGKAVAAHRATPHFQHYLSRINTLAERTATVVHAVDVAGVISA